MTIKKIPADFTVCKLADFSKVNPESEYFFMSKTDSENSLVCPAADVPENVTAREDGWRAFRVEGMLDFSLVGILAKISTLLAQQCISIFAVSTFNTDYILVKKENEERALDCLARARFEVLP